MFYCALHAVPPPSQRQYGKQREQGSSRERIGFLCGKSQGKAKTAIEEKKLIRLSRKNMHLVHNTPVHERIITPKTDKDSRRCCSNLTQITFGSYARVIWTFYVRTRAASSRRWWGSRNLVSRQHLIIVFYEFYTYSNKSKLIRAYANLLFQPRFT